MRPSILFPALVAALSSIASAQECQFKAKVGASPEGNPTIAPAVNQIVTPGTPFKITWTKTTEGDVSIVLLKGPSTNAVPYRCIVNSIPNTGEYTWTPSTDLPQQKTQYGLQIVVDKTGQFQYSPQFGIFGGKGGESTSSSEATSSTKHEHTTTSLLPYRKAVSTSSNTNVTSVIASTTVHVAGHAAITGTAPHVSHGTGVSVIHQNSTRHLTYHRSTKTSQLIKTGTATTETAAAATTSEGPQTQSSNFAVGGHAIATQAGLALAGVWGVAALVL